MAQPDSYNLTQIGKKVRKQQKVHVVATAIDSDTSISTAENEVSIPPCADISAEQTGCNAMPPPGLEDLDPATTPTVQTLSLVASPNETWHNATKAPRAHNATTRQHAPSTPQHASSVTNSTQQLQLRVHQQQEQQQEQEQQREQQQQQQQQQQQHKCDNSEKYSSGNVQAPRKVTPRPVSNVHVTKKENSMAPHVTKKASRMVWRKALPYVNKKVSYYNGEWESRTGAQNANNDDAAANNRYYNHLHRSSRKSSGTHHLTGKDGKHYTLHHTRGAKNQPMSRESWGAAVYHNRYGDAHYVNSTYAPRSWQNAYPVYGAAGRGRGGSKHPSLYGVEPRPPHHTPYGVEPRPPTVYDSKTIPYDEQWLGNDDDDQDVLAGSVHNRGGGAARLVPAALLPTTPVSTPGPVEAACCELPGCDSAVSKITSAELLEQQITEANDRLRDKLRAARTPGELRQLLHECRSDSNPAVGWFEQQLAERKLAKLEQQLAENEHLLLKPSGDVNHLVDNDNPAEKDDAAGKTLNSTANGGIVVTLDEEVGAHSSVTESEHAGSSHGLREMDNDQLSLSISDDYKAEDKEEKMLNPEAKEFIPTGSIATATSKALVAAQYEVSREPSAGEKYYNDLRMRGQRVLERMRLQMQSVWDGAPELPVCAVSATPTPSIIGGPCKLVHSPTTELSASDDLTTLSVPATPGKQPTPIVIHSDRQLERNPLYGIPTPSHPAGTGARHVGSVVKSSVALPGATNVAAVDYVLNLCGLSKFRDILVERGYDRIDFLERALNQELEAVGMKDTEARRLRRFLKSMSGTTLNPQAAEFIPGAGRPPPQMMGQLPGAAPPPAPPPVSLTLTAPAPTTLQQHHNAATANAATLSPILSASDALRSSPSATEASVLGSASVHHPGPPSLTDDVLSQVQPVDVGTSNSTMSMTGGRHRRASEVHMEDLPTKFDFLDGRDSEDEEAKEKSDDGALVDDHEAFHGEIPDEDFDFSKSHEFDCQRKPCQRLQAADSHAEMQWGSFGFAEGDENEEETATQSRLKVFAEFSKNSDSSCHHQPLGSSLPPY